MWVAVVGRGAGAQTSALRTGGTRGGAARHEFALGAWEVPDSLRTACAPALELSCLLPAGRLYSHATAAHQIRIAFGRDNPCRWRPRAEWALARDTVVVWVFFPEEHPYATCPAVLAIEMWEGTTDALPPGRYTLVEIGADPRAVGSPPAGTTAQQVIVP
jgi:hypothetical protein